MFGISAFSQVPFSSLAGEIKLAIASITCNAQMEVNIEGTVDGIVHIVTSTTVSALGNLVFKLLRRNGYIEKIMDMKRKLYDNQFK